MEKAECIKKSSNVLKKAPLRNNAHVPYQPRSLLLPLPHMSAPHIYCLDVLKSIKYTDFIKGGALGNMQSQMYLSLKIVSSIECVLLIYTSMLINC